MRRFEIVEFLKGYSIFTIIIFHFLQTLNLPSPFNKLIFFGGTGVHLFILLSGFGLYLSYLNRPISYVSFLQRRLSKIYIPYILVVAVSALVALSLPIYEGSWYAFGGHVFLYKMFDESIMNSYGYPLWFISTILQFYFVFYVFIWLEKKVGTIGFLCFTLLISLAWMIFVWLIGEYEQRVWNSFFLRYAWEFALGMFLAGKITRTGPPRINSKPLRWVLIGIVCCALYASLALYGGTIGGLINDLPALIGFSSIAIFIYLVGIPPVNRFFIFTGKISFSLYLWHFLIMLLTIELLGTPEPFGLLLALGISYILAIAYDNMVGKLFLRLNLR